MPAPHSISALRASDRLLLFLKVDQSLASLEQFSAACLAAAPPCRLKRANASVNVRGAGSAGISSAAKPRSAASPSIAKQFKFDTASSPLAVLFILSSRLLPCLKLKLLGHNAIEPPRLNDRER